MIDLGTGDGRFVLATAAARPGVLVVGIDAAAESMAEASRKAARPAKRGGLANALFVVAAAEALPAELDGAASALTVHFPWGSLLRGLLSAEPCILTGLRRVTRPGATITLLLSVTERDHVPGISTLDKETIARLAPCYASHGLALTKARPATAADLAASHSTWARRLAAGSQRPAWLLCLRTRGSRAAVGLLRAPPGEASLRGTGAIAGTNDGTDEIDLRDDAREIVNVGERRHRADVGADDAAHLP